MYAPTAPGVLPSFSLLPNEGLGANSQNLVFCLRPALMGESVPTPFVRTDAADEPMDDTWSGAKWILECRGRSSSSTGARGLVVRRGWLGAEIKEAPWDGGVKVEHVLVGLSGTFAWRNSG